MFFKYLASLLKTFKNIHMRIMLVIKCTLFHFNLFFVKNKFANTATQWLVVLPIYYILCCIPSKICILFAVYNGLQLLNEKSFEEVCRIKNARIKILYVENIISVLNAYYCRNNIDEDGRYLYYNGCKDIFSSKVIN